MRATKIRDSEYLRDIRGRAYLLSSARIVDART